MSTQQMNQEERKALQLKALEEGRRRTALLELQVQEEKDKIAEDKNRKSYAIMTRQPDPNNQIYFVYSITNKINGKKFISSSVNPCKKWTNHKMLAAKPNPSFLVDQAIKKEGAANFTFDVLGSCLPNDDPKEIEILYVDQFDCSIDGNGYNEIGRKIKARFISDEYKANLSKASIKREAEKKAQRESDPNFVPKGYRTGWYAANPEEQAALDVLPVDHAIYKITNSKNGKIYIGQTKNIDRRKSDYRRASVSNTPKTVICAAMKKYGFENFIFEILMTCSNRGEANREEQRLIAENKSAERGIGYNVALGGREGSVSQETRERLSMSAKARWARESIDVVFADDLEESIGEDNDDCLE
jgi:predicted GIY-YIG superfamily endonuclease